ncbi:hypothetical protein AB0M38_34635 [Streptomyces sp. NPDC051742]
MSHRNARLTAGGRQADHFVACYPGVYEEHAVPALHDSGVVLE